MEGWQSAEPRPDLRRPVTALVRQETGAQDRNTGYSIGAMKKTRTAKFTIGQVVRHRLFPFRGIVFDIDPEFSNTEEWYQSIPAERRPRRDQPFYHLYAENAETEYVAYVSEQNLLPDSSGEPLRHPQIAEIFEKDGDGGYRRRNTMLN
jgi:heat shock protein HspQ